MKRKTFYLVWIWTLLAGTAVPLASQIVTTTPALPVVTQAVTIYYDATQGNQGLLNYTGDVYAHTGLITSSSTSPSDWKYVVAAWTTNLPKAKMTRESANLYSLQISPTILEYYGVTNPDEKVLKMAFVFRSADRTREGKTATGGDIFVDVFEEGLNVSISQPESQSLREPNTDIPFEAAASREASLGLFVNNTEVKTLTGLTMSHVFNFPDPGDYWLKVTAADGGETAADSVFVHVLEAGVEEQLPVGWQDGIRVIDDQTVQLVLYAPGKEHVFVIGDFNDWAPSSASRMKFDPANNRWWITVTGLTAGTEYAFQYLVDGSLRIADPYTEKVLDPWNDQYIDEETYPNLKPYPAGFTSEPVSVLQTAKPGYTWTNTGFTPPDQDNLFIYELLVRDFIEKHDWKTMIDTLGYLDGLGVNAIELMPVNEFEGNLSWGYNPSFYFAPDKYYGPADDLKAFIDSCHGRGIAVILDMVLNHSFGQSPLVRLYWDAVNNRPAADNPWYNPIPKHDFNVGYDFNHESPQTQAFAKRVMQYWMEEYRVDGYRFDLSKGFTQNNTLGNIAAWNAYDASRVAIWKMYADYMWSLNPDFYVILEHLSDNPEEKELAEYGMMPWGKMTHDYTEAVMGYTSDLSWATYLERGWSVPNLVTYAESHDEERMMYKALTFGNSVIGYDTRDLETALSRVELASVFLLGIPGPKMIWQFGELGYPYSINYDIELDLVPQPYPDNSYARTWPKPIRWDYVYYHPRHRIYQLMRFMADLREQYPVFSTNDYSYALTAPQKRINLNDPNMDVTILGNFGMVQANVQPAFQQTGKWYEYFSGDSITVTNVSALLSLAPGEYRIYTTVRLKTPEFVVSSEWLPATGTGEMNFRAWPNPSDGITQFELISSGNEAMEISIFDLSGKLLKRWTDQQAGSGIHRFEWDGTNGSGQPVRPGIYFVRAQNQTTREMIRVVRK